jgi:hypothetical protein
MLTQLPGVGEFTALVILAETGDITRFPSARKLAAWAGLTPTVRGSDRTVRHGRISKQGSAWLRWALGQAAQTAKRSPELAATYQAIAARRGKQIATTAIARKLLTRAWHLLTTAAITGPTASPPPRLPREGAPSPGRARQVHEPAHPPRTSCWLSSPVPRCHGHGSPPPRARRRMGACETTPPTTHTRETAAPERPSPGPDYQPPLTGIQLVRPRRYAAAGAPAGPRPRGSHLNAATGERPAKEQSSAGNHTRSPGQINLPPGQKRPPWVYLIAVMAGLG